MKKIEQKETGELNQHSFHKGIYGQASLNIEQLLDSIQQNGMIEPIVVNQNNDVLSGERRLQVAIYLGMKEVPVITMETKPDDEPDIILEGNRHRKLLLMEIIRIIKFYYTKFKRNGGRKPKENGIKNDTIISGKTKDHVAKILNYPGLSSTYVDALNKVNLESPEELEIINKVDAGEISLSDGFTILSELRNPDKKKKNGKSIGKECETNNVARVVSELTEYEKEHDFFKITNDEKISSVHTDNTNTDSITITDTTIDLILSFMPEINEKEYGWDITSNDGQRECRARYIDDMMEKLKKSIASLKRNGSICLISHDQVVDGLQLNIPFLLVEKLKESGLLLKKIYVWEKTIEDNHAYVLHLVKCKENSDYDQNTKSIIRTEIGESELMGDEQNQICLQQLGLVKMLMQKFSKENNVVFDPFESHYVTEFATKELMREYYGDSECETIESAEINNVGNDQEAA